MKKIVAQCLCLGVLLAVFVIASAQTRRELKLRLSHDPVFGVSYDRQVIRYEILPEEISRQCAITDGKKVPLAVFAHATLGESDYYIVKEIIPVEDDYGWGTALWIKSTKCQTTGTDDVFFGISSTKGYDEAIQRRIVKDAIRRDILAYGGEVPFRKVACTPHILENTSYYAIIGQELHTFCSTAPEK
jgi:hypothetical protein